MMQNIWLLILLATTVISSFSAESDATTEDNFRYNYGYTINYKGNDSSLSHIETHVGEETKGEYFVSLPNNTSQSDVEYVANEKGYQPLVRIATKGDRSEVSSHFALDSNAVKALEESTKDSNSTKPKISRSTVLRKVRKRVIRKPLKTSANVDSKRPYDGVELIFVPETVTESSPIGITKLIDNTHNLVSNEDVIRINGAAEEYFDDVSEEQLRRSRFNFVVERNDRNRAPTIAAEITSNSAPQITNRWLSRAGKVSRSEVSILPTTETFLNLSTQPFNRQVNVQVINDHNNGQYLRENITPPRKSEFVQESTTSSIPSSTTSAPIGDYQQFNISVNLIPSTERRDSVQEPEPEPDRVATIAAESILAPIQAGLLLSGASDSDESQKIVDVSNDVVQQQLQHQQIQEPDENQSGAESLITNSEPNPVEGIAKQKEEPNQPAANSVETYASEPIIEIVEKSIGDSLTSQVVNYTNSHVTEIVRSNSTQLHYPSSLQPDFSPNYATSSSTPTLFEEVTKPIFATPIPEYLDLKPPRPPLFVPFNNQQYHQAQSSYVDNEIFKTPSPPFTNSPMNFQLPISAAPIRIIYRMPAALLFSPSYAQHSPLNFLTNHLLETPTAPAISLHGKCQENLQNCLPRGNKPFQDDYLGPVPPAGQSSYWNIPINRQSRQFETIATHPRMEYGFKPPLVPSVETDDQGIPLFMKH